VATTVAAGLALMKKNLAPRYGMVTETSATAKGMDFAPLDGLVVGGWDLRADNLFDAAMREEIVPRHLLAEVKEELSQIKPWPGVASEKYLKSMAGKHLVGAKNHRDEIAIITKNLNDFREANRLERLVMVNLTSTEKFTEVSDVHMTIEAFEKGLDKSDERISPAMKYLYAAIKAGVPHCNFTPSLSKIPALEKLSEQAGVPIAGEDGKTGQTLLKTVLAPAFAVRELRVQGWFSTNILGNNDGKVLDDPASNKTKIESKLGVLDQILGYKVPGHGHQVHIHYYPPRGDAKEAWDSIDILGFLGEQMQIKINFLCKDSILAAPLVVDLVRLLDLAKRYGEAGIQRQFSLFFKSPYHTEGEQAVHDLFAQNSMMQTWFKDIQKRSKEVRKPLAAV
jgi:myo-inositol-1-phosphate synthase